MIRQKRVSKVLLFQTLGFVAVIAMCWSRHFFNLPILLLEHLPYLSGEIWGTVIETILLLGIWLLVAFSSRQVFQKLHRLEGFMRVCSWCRRIDYKGEWMPFEKFLNQGFDTPTTHGICEHCLKQQRASMRKHRKEKEAMSAAQ